MPRPRIAVTMGDPAGIGPEICLKLLQHAEVTSVCVPVIFGDLGLLRRVGRLLDLPVPSKILPAAEGLAVCASTELPAVFTFPERLGQKVRPGCVSAETGAAACRFIEGSIDAALAGHVDAVATAPIHKEALHRAGVLLPGHTEIFARRTAAERVCMMLTSTDLTCSLVTTHVGLREVPGLLSVERILDVIELSCEAMKRLRQRKPKLVVCGLNPHAGEQGLFGDREEERYIAPAVKTARRRGIDVEGPVSADTAFLAARRQTTDCYVCMYHDQGLIPLKTLAFDRAVNVTLGLPIIRTSVDHGTACDIAWQGKADESSLVQAVLLAARLAGRAARRVEPRGHVG